mmetsp:Transcript_6051/g.18070  ORF Transcript_6051/g.18070 Transcript_6051/m.18070 type:complete len:181 (+) Transcript_6051:222-764(+)
MSGSKRSQQASSIPTMWSRWNLVCFSGCPHSPRWSAPSTLRLSVRQAAVSRTTTLTTTGWCCARWSTRLVPHTPSAHATSPMGPRTSTVRRLARLVGGSRLSLAGVRLLRSRTRSSSGSEAAGVSGAEGSLSGEKSSQINALVAIAQRIAVVVSQSPPYKAVFGAVTEAILAHAAARRME